MNDIIQLPAKIYNSIRKTSVDHSKLEKNENKTRKLSCPDISQNQKSRKKSFSRPKIISRKSSISGSQINLRFAMLGEPNCGKSAVLVRYLTGRFIGEYVKDRSLKYKHKANIMGKSVAAEFIDLCSEDSNNFCPIERCDLDGVIVVYDTTSQTSIIHSKEIVTTLNALRIPHVIVGNKRDLDGNAGLPVELEKSQNHFTVSAKEKTDGVIKAFSNLYHQLLDIDTAEGQVSKRLRARKHSTVEIPQSLTRLNSTKNRRQTVGGRHGPEIKKALSAHEQNRVCATLITPNLTPSATNTTISAGVIENLDPNTKSRRGSWFRLPALFSKNVGSSTLRKKSSTWDSSSLDDPIDVDYPSSSDSSCSSSFRSTASCYPKYAESTRCPRTEIDPISKSRRKTIL